MENDISIAALLRRRRWLRWTVIGAAVVVVVAIIVYRSVTFVSQAPQQGRRRFQDGGNQPVGVAHIDRGDIRLTLRALGAVTPLATVTVTTQISGYLMSVAFKEGQPVKKGQLLAQIDPRPYQVALEQDEAQLARDEATLKQAQMDLTRYETLSGQQSIARQTYEDQVWTVKQNQGTVDYDKAQIKAQQLNLIYCRIVAPTDGRVGLRQVDPGNYVQTGSTTGIVVLTVLKPTTVEFAVPEDSVPQVMERVHAGAQLPVTAFDRANVTQLAVGQLAAVDTQVNSTTGTVMLRANFDNADERLFPSQFVNVVMLLDTLKGVVRVPARAVQRGAPGSYVYLVDAPEYGGGSSDQAGRAGRRFLCRRIGAVARRCGRHRRRRPLARRRQGEHSGCVCDSRGSRGAEQPACTWSLARAGRGRRRSRQRTAPPSAPATRTSRRRRLRSRPGSRRRR